MSAIASPITNPIINDTLNTYYQNLMDSGRNQEENSDTFKHADYAYFLAGGRYASKGFEHDNCDGIIE
jgi:hypothetical protein